jgi:hypothetical protein
MWFTMSKPDVKRRALTFALRQAQDTKFRLRRNLVEAAGVEPALTVMITNDKR